MKDQLAAKIGEALARAAAEWGVDAPVPDVQLTIPKHADHGDYATNVAMMFAKVAGKNPREIATKLVEQLGYAGGLVRRCDIAGPGFINFFVNTASVFDVVRRIEAEGASFGRTAVGVGRRVLVEFVSANPTGPLHIGHGRGAVVGDALASLLDAAGFAVEREYYVNDAGLQIQTLGRSTYLRYRQLIDGVTGPLEQGLYQGDYMIDHARALRAERGDGVTEADIPEISLWTGARILREILDDLAALGVRFDRCFSEKTLYDAGTVDRALQTLRDGGFAFDEEGALWLDTVRFGDEKNRVLVKSNGEKTYLAGDVAYHANKIDRGFDELIDIWGADHHGYVARMKAAIAALGRDPNALSVLLIQMVSLMRGGERVSMSTRAGEFYTLQELREEVGRDSTRWFFLMRRYDAQLDFDVDLAKERSNKNPVFYVQYMHARICSIFAKAAEAGVSIPRAADVDFAKLTAPEEVEIAQRLAELPNVVTQSALAREPHRLTVYLSELAGLFHPYYFQHRILTDDAALTAARLALCAAVKQATANALAILGINAPETM